MNPIVNPGPISVEATATINPNGNRTIAWFEYSADSGQSGDSRPTGTTAKSRRPLWCEAYGGDDSCSKPLFGNTPQPFNRTINEPNINTYFGPDPLPLEPNTNYMVRVHAQNPGGDSISPALPFKTKTLPPVVQTLNGTGGPDTGQLSAKINPKNAPVTYQFEWGVKEGDEDETYENLDPVPAEGSAAGRQRHAPGLDHDHRPGAGNHLPLPRRRDQHPDERSQHGAPIGPSRPVAPPAGPEGCPNESSRVGPSAKLPDCRAFEFVTPGLNQARDHRPGPGWHAYGSRRAGRQPRHLQPDRRSGQSRGLSTSSK